jgi:predicted transcriptional regulator
MVQIDSAERAVLEVLQQANRPTEPSAVVKRVQKNKRHLSDAAIREAIWRLLDRTDLLLTEDRLLKRRG